MYKNKVLPFVAYLKGKVEQKGLQAFNTTLDLDEFEVLKTCAHYIENALEVRGKKCDESPR